MKTKFFRFIKKSVVLFPVVLLLCSIFLIPNNNVKADTAYSNVTNTGVLIDFSSQRYVNQGAHYDMEGDLRVWLYDFLDLVVEPQGFESGGGGFLSAIYPMNYLFISNGSWYQSNQLYVDFYKIYQSGSYYYEDINFIFGSTDFNFSSSTNGYFRIDSLINNYWSAQCSGQLIFSSSQVFQLFYRLSDYSYFDYVSSVDYSTYLASATTLDNSYLDTYNSGINQGHSDVISNPSLYGLYTQAQYNSYGASQYSLGVQSVSDYSFTSLFGAIAIVPFTMFKSLFDFNVLGFNMLTFISSLITLCVILFIIRLFLGGKND